MSKSEMFGGQYVAENIRSNFNKQLGELCKDYLNDENKENFPFDYIGKVVNNNDPLKLGRCRIRIYNLFEDTIPDSDLPWALPAQPIIEGSFCIPIIGSLVYVRFQHGDLYTPVYTSKVSQKNKVPSKALKNYPNNMTVYETDGGSYFVVDRKTNKIVIGNNNVELLDLISQILDALMQSVVPTALGPQQLSKVTDTTVLQIQQKLNLLKGSI